MTPRTAVKEERIQQILDAAMIVFARKGFHQATMDDIVAQSGLSKGTIYWYFKSKDEIIWRIMGRIFESELENLRELQLEDSSAGSRIKKFISLALNDLEGMLMHIPLTYEFISAAARDNEIRQVLKNYLRGYIELLNPIIQQGIDSGEFRPIDAQDAAIAIGGIFEGIILLWVYDPETVELKSHINASIELLLEGLNARG